MNLYAYCMNNPVMYVDPSGEFSVSVFVTFIIIGALAGGLTRGIEAYNDGKLGWDLIKEISIGFGVGLLIGAGVGAVAAAGGFWLIGGISSVSEKFVSDLYAHLVFGIEFSRWEEYAATFIIGGITNKITVKPLASLFLDSFVQPITTQLFKIGLGRQENINWSKYGYDISTRAITNMSPKPWKLFYRGTARGIWYDYHNN